MTAKEDLLKKLRARPHPIARVSYRLEWQAAYLALLDSFAGWLRELPSDLVRVSYRETRQLLHDDLGTYTSAPTLDIDLCGALVCVEPLARTSQGMQGTVALSRASETRKFWRHTDGSWEVEPPPYGYKRHLWDPIPLTQETFYGVLCDLLR